TLYDEAGHWLGDYDNTGAALQQAIWLDDLPVGLIANGNQLHYVEPDHLGTPRVVIEVARNVPVWTWDLKSEAFGNSVPAQDPDGDATPLVFDMRFPGQQYDANTGLNYNYFRNYDPALGRYIESDPLGLDGGVATYLYGFGNPTGIADHFGLDGRPGFGDQINPGGIRGDGVKDYTNYFDSRFPKTMAGAAQILKNRILKKICDKFGNNASQLPALNSGADDIDVQPDMARFGDRPQSWYERNVQIGAFQIQTSNVSIRWDNPPNMCSSCFSYGASMYVSENTGDNRIPGFKERNVRMGSWKISGRHCCGR
ncbi:RHS repeat domain-containing protein, partial [Pseudoxanthomonas sacheonensis]|uniref:RHS repeat domain-containing protein n=1 Tax=Pseudoxanthomonas sacheonensis TaxID=443615 RepID=UPI0013D7D4FE